MISKGVDADRVRSIDLFQDVSDPHFRSLLKSATLRRVSARTLLFKEGGLPTALHLLIEGSVELFSRRDDWRSITVAIIRSAQPCVFAGIIRGRNPVSARTLAPSDVLLIPAQVVLRMIATDAHFARAATRAVVGDYYEAVEGLKNRGMRTALGRVAYWMLRFDHDAGEDGAFTLPCDKATLASYLGMAPENLSRNLAALAPVGLVVRGRRIMLNDRHALADVAGVKLDHFTRDQRTALH
jgi:CRP/FNR family transcriptional regulator, transcriptional activator FtrB